ncbi:MAG: hypothetical protein AMXMBFR47_13800 [Planctomycetota bacterium]
MTPPSCTNADPAAVGMDFAAELAGALAPALPPDARAAAVRRLLADHPPPADAGGLDGTEARTAELTLARILSRIPLADAGPVAGRLVRAVLFLPLTPGERLHAVCLVLADFLETRSGGRR